MFLVGFMLLVLLVFASYQSEKMSDLENEKEYTLIQDLGYKIEKEFDLASRLQDGYTRTFSLPEKLEGYNYSLQHNSNIVILSTENEEFFVTIPDVVGQLNKGNNTIVKKTNMILLE